MVNSDDRRIGDVPAASDMQSSGRVWWIRNYRFGNAFAATNDSNTYPCCQPRVRFFRSKREAWIQDGRNQGLGRRCSRASAHSGRLPVRGRAMLLPIGCSAGADYADGSVRNGGIVRYRTYLRAKTLVY